MDLTLLPDLDSLIEPTTRGDPESICAGLVRAPGKLARDLKNMGHNVSHTRVAEMLCRQGYSLQSNQKIIEEITILIETKKELVGILRMVNVNFT